MYRVARTSGERRDEEAATDVSAGAAAALVGGAGVGAWQRCKQCKVPGVRGQSERGRSGGGRAGRGGRGGGKRELI